MKIEIPCQGKVISFYGAEKQSMVHCEECAELIQAISKMRRVKDAGKDDSEAYYNLVEEMADVLVVLEQLQEMYDIPNTEIQSMVFKKCRRQEARIHDAH